MKHNKDKDNPQLPLIPEPSALDKLDPRVRSTYIGGEQFVSALDILQYHANKKNPTQSWRVTLEYMERQGYSTPNVEHQFDGRGQRPTPIINLETFLRFVQSAEVPEWEPIRQWLAKQGAEVLKSKAARRRENEIAKYTKAGYGESPEVKRLAAYNEAIGSYNDLRDTFLRVCDNPDWRLLANSEYQALFGMIAQQLKAVLENENIRQALGTDALETMAFAEKRLRSVLSTQQNLSNERIQEIIQIVVAPLGIYLRSLSQLEGKDVLTGQPLLEKKGKSA